MNQPLVLAKVLSTLEGIQKDFNATGKKVSLADLIVLGGCAAVEAAAKKAGYDIKVPFAPGRTDASQEQTDVTSFAPLEQTADGFRNYLRLGHTERAEELLVDRAQLLTLTAPEMAVLVGGLRVLGANYRGSKNGVFTTKPETLTNDFFVNLLDMATEWKASSTSEGSFEGLDRATGEIKVDRHSCRSDLRFQLSTPGHRGSLRIGRLEGSLREGLRSRVDQGHEPRPLRPAQGVVRRSYLNSNKQGATAR